MVTVVTTLVLLLLGTATDQYIRYSLERDHYQEIQRVVAVWSTHYRNGTLPAVIPTEGQEVNFIQVVDPSGRVIAASAPLEGLPPLSDMRPPPENRVKHFTECGTRYGCLMIVAARLGQEPAFIYAADPAPALLTGHRLDYVLLLTSLFLVFLVAWATWRLVGRTLRPVKEISARMADISASDLSMRVPVPSNEGEITDLARTANDTLSRLEKSVEEQRRFVSDVSHELRNPVAGISLQLEEALLEREETNPWPVIESSLTSVGRLSAIIDDLLAISRLQTSENEMELIDLGDFVTANALGHPKVRIEADHGLLVRGSRVRLARLLANLLNNAVRHAVSKVEVTVTREDHDALLAVADDGAGVPEADREKIFERFVRLAESERRDPAGSGLGLAISRDIAEAHGGTLVLAESRIGARFELRLPLLRSATAPEDPSTR